MYNITKYSLEPKDYKELVIVSKEIYNIESKKKQADKTLSFILFIIAIAITVSAITGNHSVINELCKFAIYIYMIYLYLITTCNHKIQDKKVELLRRENELIKEEIIKELNIELDEIRNILRPYKEEGK